jgi:MFS family permease
MDQMKGPQFSDTGQGEYPRPAYAWYVVVVLFFAYVVSFMDRQIMSLLIEPIKADLEISDTTISLLHGFAFAVFYTIVGIPLGRLADSRNRKSIIMIGISFWSLMTSLCGLAQNTLMLFLTRIGVGIGEASLLPSAYSIISDYFPREKRGRAASVFSLGIFAGGGLAFIFGGVVVDFAARAVASGYPIISGIAPWKLTFILAGLPGVLVVLLMITVREPIRREKLRKEAGSIPLADAVAYLRRYWKAYFTIIVGTACLSIATYGLFTWTPAYFIRVYDYTPRMIGITFGSIILLTGTSGLLLGSYLADRMFSKGRTCAHLDIIILLTGIGIFPAAFLMTIVTPGAALICLAVLLFCLSVHTGLSPAVLQLITPNELRGQIIAIYMFVLNLVGLGIGPMIVALITDRYYEDTLAVGKSMSITISLALILGVLILFAGRQAYIKRHREINLN